MSADIFPPAPPSDAWRAQVVPIVTRTIVALLDLRDEVCPQCELSGPGFDERLAVLALSWDLSRRAVEQALKELECFVIRHCHAHAKWRAVVGDLA